MSVIPNWQFNVVPGNAVKSSILLTRHSIGEPPFNQSDFIWKPMEEVVGTADIKLEFEPENQVYQLYKAVGHINPDTSQWEKEWIFVGSWMKAEEGWTPTPTQLSAMNSGIDSIKVQQIETNRENIIYLDTHKANLSDVYVKQVVDTLLNAKANKVETYTKNEVDTLLNNKIDVGVCYTKQEIDALLLNKQDSIEDHVAGSPPTDNDFLSDLDGTYNKRWTFGNIWLWIKGKITQVFYPIGSVVFNMGTNPSNNYGGTWELLADGTKALYLDSTAGTTINEELPNIKGKIQDVNFRGSSAQAISKSGALSESVKSNGNAIGCGTPHGDVVKSIVFNASKSNSTYKDNGKVRAEGITICAWKRTA